MSKSLTLLAILLPGIIAGPSLAGTESARSATSGLIIAFGDSLTAGLGVAPTETYPALLEKRLQEENLPYRVLNAGVSGDTTSGGLSRINEVLKFGPEIVILEFGANDGFRGTSLDLIQSNLAKMIEKLQRKKIKVLLAGMKIPPNYGKEYSEGFYQIYPNLAKRYHLHLVPFLLEGVAAREGLNQADGIHPTAEGYKVVLENVWKPLVPLLKRGREN